MKFSIMKLITLFFLTLLFFTACKKKDSTDNATPLESFFEKNVLNRNFLIQFASDNSTDITSEYNGYTFVLLKTDFYHGPLQATKNAVTVMGSWSSNSDYSKLIITLPETPSEFVFLTRAWRFTSKSTSLLKLAPWGSSEPLVLYMVRQ